MKYSKLINIYSALAILGRRKLPSLKSDLKIAKMIRLLQPQIELYEEFRKKIVANYTDSGAGTDSTMRAEGELQNLLNQETDDVVSMKLRVLEEDLPLSLKGVEGESNSAGIGSIIADLGPLYEFSDDDVDVEKK